MAELIATIGLQASGKTTWARSWVREDPANRVRVERDCLREMLGFGFVKENERVVTDIRNQIAENFLMQGKSVVVSDTNFPWKVLRELRGLAVKHGVGFRVLDLTDVPVEVCIARDQGRDKEVGPKVILDFHDRYLGKSVPYPYPLPPEEDVLVWEPYEKNADLPECVIVDIDGTLAKMDGRSPYDWDRVDEDLVSESVEKLLETLCGHFHGRVEDIDTILLSGRDSAAREKTESWLESNGICYTDLFMRAAGDTRKDDLVKYELFNEHIRGKYDVWFVLDDRDQVVRMWRDLGLDCWQVAYGNF